MKSYKLHRLTERDSRLERYFPLFGGLGLRLGYLATSGAKSDAIFSLGDPDFLYSVCIFRTLRRNFARILRSFRDLRRDRLTTDAATETEGSHTVTVRA